jgi:hypothetical protein
MYYKTQSYVVTANASGLILRKFNLDFNYFCFNKKKVIKKLCRRMAEVTVDDYCPQLYLGQQNSPTGGNDTHSSLVIH